MLPEPAIASEVVVTSFLADVERRVQVGEMLRATTLALLVAAAALAIAPALHYRPGVVRAAIAVIAVAVVGIALWKARPRWSGDAVAARVERATPDSRNVIFTARELLSDPSIAAPWMRRRVVDAAASVVGRASPPTIVPLRRDVWWLTLAAAATLAIAAGVPAQWARTLTTAVAPGGTSARLPGASRLRVTATVTSPTYTGVPPRSLVDPETLEVIQGSRVAIAVTGSGPWSIRFGARVLTTRPADESRIELTPDESGYFAIERDGVSGERRLLPVTVTPDRAPTVRIDSPGRDLLLPAPRGTIALAASAADDFGLVGLELRYTKVSGSGEQFEFVEGALPLSISRDNARAWKGSGAFDLARLGLEPGDSLVYRAVARDGRPGDAGVATSDTFFIEVAGPGQVALPGFELPPDRERYALSQQMIVLKLERLRARQATLAREALGQEVDVIAAEQRAVRANFIFLMGGHVEDEEEEAAQSNEIQEGRLENSARREINIAIRFMSQVEQALAGVDTGAALPPARLAVAALQRAFGRNRYFLKTLAVRSRLDPARRLTGDLKEASDWQRMLAPAAADPKTAQARLLLSRLLALLPDGDLPSAASASAIGTLAEEALAVDPASPDWQRISSALTKLRDAVAGGKAADDTRRAVGAAVTPLVAVSKKSAVPAGEASGAPDALRGAWAGEARRR